MRRFAYEPADAYTERLALAAGGPVPGRGGGRGLDRLPLHPLRLPAAEPHAGRGGLPLRRRPAAALAGAAGAAGDLRADRPGVPPADGLEAAARRARPLPP